MEKQSLSKPEGGKTGGKESKPEGGTKPGQPTPEGYEIGGSGGCGVWTPFGGCSGNGPKIWETTSQPHTDERGTVTVSGSARPNAGTAAVINNGDGGFVSSSGRDGNGGLGYDPCATVKSAGCGGLGPQQPGPESGQGGQGPG